jgi:hypothetical protein
MGLRTAVEDLMAVGNDAGIAPVPIVLSALVGVVIAAVSSIAIVAAGTSKPAEPVTKPLITYDSP